MQGSIGLRAKRIEADWDLLQEFGEDGDNHERFKVIHMTVGWKHTWSEESWGQKSNEELAGNWNVKLHISGLVLQWRGPQSLGCRPVCGLVGTRLHSRRWVVGEWAKLHLPLPITPHCSSYRLNHLPPLSMEKLSSTKLELVPGAKKVGDCCSSGNGEKGWTMCMYTNTNIHCFLPGVMLSKSHTLDQVRWLFHLIFITTL